MGWFAEACCVGFGLCAARRFTWSPGGVAVGTLTFFNRPGSEQCGGCSFTRHDSLSGGGQQQSDIVGMLNIADAGGFTAGDFTLFTYGGVLTTDGLMIGRAIRLIVRDRHRWLAEVRLHVTVLPATLWIDALDLQDRFGLVLSGIGVLVVDTEHWVCRSSVWVLVGWWAPIGGVTARSSRYGI